MTDAEATRLSVLGKSGSEDMESKAVPEPTRKPKTSLSLFVLSLNPQVWVNQSTAEGSPIEKEAENCCKDERP